jgi:mono/diheme cytochrome c family protein
MGGRSKTIAVFIAAVVLVVAVVLWRPHLKAVPKSPSTDAAKPVVAIPATHELNPGSVEFYDQKVKPIFAANCYRCHGGMNHKGGLSIVTMAGMLKGGHDGSVLVPGHPEESMLIKLIRHEGPKNDPMPMPPSPRPKISDADIATVTAWVAAGAPMSAPEQ